MAAADNIVRLAEFRHTTDRALEAKKRVVAAGEDDAAYELAIAELEAAPATSVAGVAAKFERLCSYLSDASAGNQLTDNGWGKVLSLCEGIDTALARLGQRAA